jgi:hypothetical protein
LSASIISNRQDTGASTRDRDLLPSSGADTFLTFVTSELRAYVDSTYSTSRQTTLFGHSYGGLFTVYALLTHPESFDHYIASDPALWWNAGSLTKIATAQLRRFPSDRKTLFIGGRAGRINEALGIRQFTALLSTRAPASLRWKSVANDDEDHGSVRLKNIYDGLKFSYFGHSGAPIDVFPTDGILLAGKPIGIRSYTTSLGENPGVRYTTDGSVPTATSPRYEYGIQVSAPARLTVKQFTNWGPDKARTGRFVVGKTIAAEPLPADAKRGRIHVERPDGSNAGFAPGFEIGSLGGKAPFALSFTGWFEAQASGYYVFFLDADGTASLRVGGRTLLNISGDSGSRSFAAPLAKGFHRIEVGYRHHAGDPRLDLTYLSPAADRDPLAHLPIPIASALLFAR